jgi:ABC-type sugar transport system ATPase subunit
MQAALVRNIFASTTGGDRVRSRIQALPGGITAVEDLSLAIMDREFMIFVGPSGCGKTTVLRMVAGLDEISEGEVRIGGRRVNELDPQDRDIAMVFQNYALYPHMYVRENIAFPLRMQRTGRAEIDRRVGEVAALLGIEQLLARKPGELSAGQRRRVAMSRAIVRHPQVFLMDVPLSNLDAKLRIQMRVELVRLGGDGVHGEGPQVKLPAARRCRSVHNSRDLGCKPGHRYSVPVFSGSSGTIGFVVRRVI